MKTTLELDDSLDAQVRKTAHLHGWTLKETVSKALRAGLEAVSRKESRLAPLKLTLIKGPLLVDISDRDALSEAMGPPELP